LQAGLALHAPAAAPDQPVSAAELKTIKTPSDARDSYTLSLRCRSSLLAAGALPRPPACFRARRIAAEHAGHQHPAAVH
jgi:hypothetical protein